MQKRQPTLTRRQMYMKAASFGCTLWLKSVIAFGFRQLISFSIELEYHILPVRVSQLAYTACLHKFNK